MMKHKNTHLADIYSAFKRRSKSLNSKGVLQIESGTRSEIEWIVVTHTFFEYPVVELHVDSQGFVELTIFSGRKNDYGKKLFTAKHDMVTTHADNIVSTFENCLRVSRELVGTDVSSCLQGKLAGISAGLRLGLTD